MVREARAAYRRRDEEAAQQRKNIADAQQQTDSPRRGERSWWEASGIDGAADIAMSPLPEETDLAEEVENEETDEEKIKKLGFAHTEDGAHPRIKWEVMEPSEPESPESGEGSSSSSK